jgi:two-component system, NtrC family, nitrogen regulation response regulator NtrX
MDIAKGTYDIPSGMTESEDFAGRRIVLVDDERNIRRMLTMVLTGEGYSVESFDSAEAFLGERPKAPVDLVLLDVRLPGMDGIEALKKVRDQFPAVPVVMISGHASIEEAVRAVNLGASDFLEKPLNRERVLATVRASIERRRLEAKVRALESGGEGLSEMLGDSEALNEVRKQIRKVAGTSARVLITGESGTGKELIAREIHRASQRANGPFVKVNCAAIPQELIESELFGHERGAFSGAVQKKRGQFELADGGTLFLDEIGDMSLEGQAKVLRALQTGEINRVGAERTIVVDARVIAATNKDLMQAVSEGGFREDLYFRLSVVPIHCPPLREREGDVLSLMRWYLAFFSQEHAVNPPVGMTETAEHAVEHYAFPGNVRELKNLAERLVILTEGDVDISDLPRHMVDASDQVSVSEVSREAEASALAKYGTLTMRDLREAVERDYILMRLTETDWNITKTAESLGIERTNLHKKLKHLGLKRRSQNEA